MCYVSVNFYAFLKIPCSACLPNKTSKIQLTQSYERMRLFDAQFITGITDSVHPHTTFNFRWTADQRSTRLINCMNNEHITLE